MKAYPDGRCLFRSLAIGINTKLQEGERDEFGLLTDPILKVHETNEADSCAKLISYMCVNVK